MEFGNILRRFDAIATVPSVLNGLLSHGVPASKLVAVAHSEIDIVLGVERCGVGIYEQVYGYAVIHPDLVEVSRSAGIERVPLVTPNGIDFDYYYTPISSGLKCLGYAGAPVFHMSNRSECKRSHLLRPICDGVGLPLRWPERMHYLAMAGHYESVDSLIVTSSYEGCGLPAMEAAAAGRLVLGAQVGAFDGSSGLLCRTPDLEFVEDAVAHLNRCKDPAVYRLECERAQQYARDHYDWDHVIERYVELLN
jgi:glycosyltransferase involved in cell wall biosynthesis